MTPAALGISCPHLTVDLLLQLSPQNGVWAALCWEHDKGWVAVEQAAWREAHVWLHLHPLDAAHIPHLLQGGHHNEFVGCHAGHHTAARLVQQTTNLQEQQGQDTPPALATPHLIAPAAQLKTHPCCHCSARSGHNQAAIPATTLQHALRSRRPTCQHNSNGRDNA